MPLVLVGLLLIALKAAEVGPFAACPWWLATTPLVLAILWWKFSDSTGLDKRREMDRMEERKAERRRNALMATGQGPEAEKERRDAEKARVARQAEVDRVEARRAKVRQKNRDSLLGSRYDSEIAPGLTTSSRERAKAQD
jgi:small Trp-rich protein